MDAPPGLEPGLFGIKIRRVANYTKGQYEWWGPVVTLHSLLQIGFTDRLPKLSTLGPLILYTLSVNPILDCGKESDIRQRSPSVSLA